MATVVVLSLLGCQRQAEAPAAAAASAASTTPATNSRALEVASQATGFTVGALMASHTVYVFFDPACPHCARLWSAAQPLLPRLKMVWIPVGFLRNSSAPVGATILSSSKPAEAMQANESSMLEGGPGLAPAEGLDDAMLAKVKDNTERWQAAGGQSVPFLVYRDPKTGQAATHEGELDTAALASLLGL